MAHPLHLHPTRTEGNVVTEPVCEATGGACDPSYAWSAPRLAKMLDEVREALGAPIDATHAEVLARIDLLQASVGERQPS